jgi:hypothetical protein
MFDNTIHIRFVLNLLFSVQLFYLRAARLCARKKNMRVPGEIEPKLYYYYIDGKNDFKRLYIFVFLFSERLWFRFQKFAYHTSIAIRYLKSLFIPRSS